MSIARQRNAFKWFRDLLFSILNKEFLIFSFFLVLSSVFWLVLTLNETVDKELVVSVRLEGVPQKVVITSEPSDTIHVTVRDKGYMLLGYVYGNAVKSISLKFASFDKGNGKIQVSANELQKLLYAQMHKSTRITQLKPDRLEFLYNYGASKRVAVKLNGKVQADDSHYIANIRFKPEQVLVYANASKLDSIQQVLTTKLNIEGVVDTMQQTVSLQRMRGVKFVPAQVEMFIYPDVLAEAIVEVPVVALNMPPGKKLRTFPQKVKVIFVAGASIFQYIHAEQFQVVADYNEIVNHPSDKCPIRVVAKPRGVRNARPEVSYVDYLIEEE